MICIIGAGPAGLAAAIALGDKALVLEANPFAGKKLLLSGSGQCNFSNSLGHEAFLLRLGDFRNWLKPAYLAFDNQFFMQFLQDMGCPVVIRDDGKAFPADRKSASVRDTLLQAAIQKGARFRYNAVVEEIIPRDDKYSVLLQGGEAIPCEAVVISSGGASWPVTGSDGASYRWARKLGHKVQNPCPALAGVKITDFQDFSSLAGISISAAIINYEGKKSTGDLLFTHQGLSGPVILDKSYRMQKGGFIKLILMASAEEKLLATIAKHPRKQIGSLVSGLGIPDRLVKTIMFRHNIQPLMEAAKFTKEQRKFLAKSLEGLEFTISKVEGLDVAMSDFGGVPLKEVNSKTMESRLNKNLYFAGESLAYTLPTGGFSIQMAFSTGFLAGTSILKNGIG